MSLLTNVAGGFAVILVRNETQQYSAALKSAGQNPVSLLPLKLENLNPRALWCCPVAWFDPSGYQIAKSKHSNDTHELLNLKERRWFAPLSYYAVALCSGSEV